MYAKCPHCKCEFEINSNNTYSQSRVNDDNKLWIIKEIDCPGCKSHIEFKAKYELSSKTCIIRNADGNLTEHIDGNSKNCW